MGKDKYIGDQLRGRFLHPYRGQLVHWFRQQWCKLDGHLYRVYWRPESPLFTLSPNCKLVAWVLCDRCRDHRKDPQQHRPPQDRRY